MGRILPFYVSVLTHLSRLALCVLLSGFGWCSCLFPWWGFLILISRPNCYQSRHYLFRLYLSLQRSRPVLYLLQAIRRPFHFVPLLFFPSLRCRGWWLFFLPFCYCLVFISLDLQRLDL